MAGLAGLADDDERLAGEAGRDLLGLRLPLKVARLELVTLGLELLAVGIVGAQRLALRQQEIAGEAVADADDVSHLAEAGDALEKDDFHGSYSVRVMIMWKGRARPASRRAKIEEEIGGAGDREDERAARRREGEGVGGREQAAAGGIADGGGVDDREADQRKRGEERAGQELRQPGRNLRQDERQNRGDGETGEHFPRQRDPPERLRRAREAGPKRARCVRAMARLNTVISVIISAPTNGSTAGVGAHRRLDVGGGRRIGGLRAGEEIGKRRAGLGRERVGVVAADEARRRRCRRRWRPRYGGAGARAGTMRAPPGRAPTCALAAKGPRARRPRA